MEALSNLQKSFIQSNYYYEQFNANEFKHELLENIDRQNGGAVTKQVSQIDEKTIDFVEMLFSEIIADNSISEHITNLLLKDWELNNFYISYAGMTRFAIYFSILASWRYYFYFGQ